MRNPTHLPGPAYCIVSAPHARRMGIPCLFTVHNIHTQKLTMGTIEDRGIDVAGFWNNLYFERPPHNYEESRSTNHVDLLTSGIFGAHFINTVSPEFLNEIVMGSHDFIPPQVRQEMQCKFHAGCAKGILNAPDENDRPEVDNNLVQKYSHLDHQEGKRINKLAFQQRTGLHQDPDAPLLFWPSRLDPMQKGCQLLAEILYNTVAKYRHLNLQIAIIANGSYQQVFRDIVNFHNIHNNVTVCDFDDPLSHLGFGAADFILIPSRFEPCGLPQMTCQYYGGLPIAMNTGGLHDTVEHLSEDGTEGNGFRFDHHDAGGLAWAIDEAMRFYTKGPEFRNKVITRVMQTAPRRFNHDNTAQEYIKIYEAMLQRPLVRDIK